MGKEKVEETIREIILRIGGDTKQHSIISAPLPFPPPYTYYTPALIPRDDDDCDVEDTLPGAGLP